MNQRIAEILVKYRLVFFLASIFLLGVTALGFTKLKYISDYKVFFSPDDPNLAAFEHLEDTFSKVENVVFFISPKDKNIFSNEALSSLLWLTEKSWQLPYSIRVDSLSNYQHTSANNDELLVEDLVTNDFAKDRSSISKIREIALAEPMLVNQLISANGDSSLIYVTLQLPSDPTAALPTLVQGANGVEAVMTEFKSRYPDIEIHVAGVAIFNYYTSVVASEDFAKLLPGLLGVILILTGVMTRSFSNTLVTLSVIVLSITITIGSIGLGGIVLDNISAMAPLIIMTLAVAESVHLLGTYSLRLREGHSKENAMILSLSSNLRAVFLTSFTTAVGFLGMCTSDSPPFVKFGYISALGIVVAYFLGHTVLPALAIWLSKPHNKQPEVHSEKFHSRAAEWVISNPRKVFHGTLSVSLILSACIFLNELNDDSVGYFGKNVPVRITTETAESRGFGMNFIEYKMDSRKEYGVTDPAFLADVDSFVRWYRAQPEVTHVASFTDTLKRINQNLHNDDPAYYKLPESRELAAQYLLLYEMSLPQGKDLNNQIDTQKSALRITVSTPMMKARQNIALDERAQNWMSQNAPHLKTPGASPTIMFSHIGQTNVKSIMWGTFSSIAVICLCMIFGFGSIRLGLMALLPNIFPSAIVLGIWGIFVGEMNMGVAVIFTVTSGIIVDDTIHLFTKFSDGLRRGFSIDDSIRYTFAQAGRGVVTTTVVLCAGFAMLVFSDFMVNLTLGIMVSATIAVAILFDLLFLPSVLKVFPLNTQKFSR